MGSGSGSVEVSPVLPLNSFIQEAANQKFILDEITFQVTGPDAQTENIQLATPFHFVSRTPFGEGNTQTVMPELDEYRSVSVVKGMTVKDFILDGLSSIEYDVQPGCKVLVKLMLNKYEPTYGEWIKNQLGAKSTFDLVDDLPVPDEFREYEEIVNSKPIIQMIQDANKITDQVIEAGTEKKKSSRNQKKKYQNCRERDLDGLSLVWFLSLAA
jgi:hypothetical protein